VEVNSWRYDYSKKREFLWFLASDLQLGNPDCDEGRIKRDFQEAHDTGARILLNGDIIDLILPSDVKRYSAGRDRENVDASINVAVDNAARFLTPWVNDIDMIGVGNHETAPLKYCATDATLFLLRDLNRERDSKLPPIVHGGYTGFMRFSFYFGKNGRTQTFDLFYNHGQGGSSEVTRGAIDLSRRQYVSADLIWLGHKHKRILMDMDCEVGLTGSGTLYEKEKRGVITGCYLKNNSTYDISKGYRLNYAEQRMRTPQAQGGAWLRIVIPTAHAEPEMRVTV
jgi:hypothetical protein